VRIQDKKLRGPVGAADLGVDEGDCIHGAVDVRGFVIDDMRGRGPRVRHRQRVPDAALAVHNVDAAARDNREQARVGRPRDVAPPRRRVPRDDAVDLDGRECVGGRADLDAVVTQHAERRAPAIQRRGPLQAVPRDVLDPRRLESRPHAAPPGTSKDHHHRPVYVYVYRDRERCMLVTAYLNSGCCRAYSSRWRSAARARMTGHCL
jgi:hypothetical protein